MQVTDEMVRVAISVISGRGEIPPSERAMRECLTAALAAMWRDMSTAPKDGSSVLLGFHDCSFEGFWHDGSRNYFSKSGWYFADDDLLTAKPCEPHCWMYLPAPSQLSKRDDAERDAIQEA